MNPNPRSSRRKEAQTSLCLVTAFFFIYLTCPIPAAETISFNRDIRPLLADRCFSCHGPDSASRKAGLRLDREQSAKAANDGMTPIVPGNPAASAIIRRMTHSDRDELMPPPESKISMSDAEIALLRTWIEQGAQWERHWAFIAPTKSGIASNKPAKWIDHFIQRRLEKEGLNPSPPANPAHLLRRVSFDLTGLPPTLKELDAFLSDPSDAAFREAVDRLLASSAFGERMALEWLDVARYGDTDGLFEDHPRSIYPWRDWVVRAFNNDLSYRDFIAWQIAGDLLPDATEDQKLATGFLRNNVTSNEGGIIDEDYRIKYVVDRVNTTATAFLGLTLECAQCHDHKYDPMSQREYYEFSGFFNSLKGRGNTKGSTDPILKLQTPKNKARLAAIANELKNLAKAERVTSPKLLANLDEWRTTLHEPVDWKLAHKAPVQKNTAKSYPESKTKARFVRLELPAGQVGFMTISEVEIHSGGSNIARSGKATQSSVGYRSPANKAIDGNNDGRFASCSCTNNEKDAWWEIDLGAEFPIDHILVFNRNDCCPERLDKVSVKVLSDDRTELIAFNTGDAPFRSAFTVNTHAPAPVDKAPTRTITLTSTNQIAALQFSAPNAGSIRSLKLQIIGKGRPRPVKLAKDPKLAIAPDKPAIAGLESPLKLAKGEKLQLTVTGSLCDVSITSDQTATLRGNLSSDRDKQLDYYRTIWPGFADLRKKRASLTEEQKKITAQEKITMIASDNAKMRPTYMLNRGEYDNRGEEVKPGALGSIFPYSKNLPANRLGLAKWLTDPKNPLTARVVVNRYWQMIFGIGLVKTSEDFGTQGDRPSHPELLDTLTVDFVESGWDVKRLLRNIVTSQTYRQSSRRSPGLAKRDPENRFLARGSRRRLKAEFLRDHALSTSGLLVRKIGGPGVNPYQPAVLFGRNAIGSSGAKFTQGRGDDLYRRSLYTYWKRQIPAANIRILGADGRTTCRTRREVTNTPLQAFVMLNDPQFVEAARMLGQRAMKKGGSSARDRISHAFRLATSRHINERELKILLAEFEDRLYEFKTNAEVAKQYLNGGGEKPIDPSLAPAEAASYAAIASLILNLDESLSSN